MIFRALKDNNNKNISDLKNANLKKDAVSSIYPHFLIYRSFTEKSNTYDVSFPRASISKNNSMSLNQLKAKNYLEKYYECGRTKLVLKSNLIKVILQTIYCSN